jgi:peroxiredoxin Q/BCP
MWISITYPDQSTATVTYIDLISQSDYTILYFYPKDNTPGCTLEAINFNTIFDQFQALHCQLVWISKDNHKSHCRFVDLFWLKFPLISDESLELHTQFDTRVDKKMMGKTYKWTQRSTFVVDRMGNILHTRRDVSVIWHGADVLWVVQKLIWQTSIL